LLAELSYIEPLVVGLADLIGSCSCAFSLSRNAAGTYRRALCATFGLRCGYNERSITVEGAGRPVAFTVDGHGTTRSQDDGNDDSDQGQDTDPESDFNFVSTAPRALGNLKSKSFMLLPLSISLLKKG